MSLYWGEGKESQRESRGLSKENEVHRRGTFLGNSFKNKTKVHAMRQQIDLIKDQFDDRMVAFEHFKSLIKFKKNKNDEVVGNDFFGLEQHLGLSFLERQQIAKEKIM